MRKNSTTRMNRRDFLKLTALGLSATAAAGALAACVPAPAAPIAPPAPAAGAPTAAVPTAANPAAGGQIAGKLTVWGWSNGPLRDAAGLFVKQNPNVQFAWTDMSWQDTHQKLAVTLAAGTGAPDVVSLDGAQIQKFVKLGGLLDITDAMAASTKDFPAYKIREASDAKGHTFAVPWDIGPCSLFYRKDIFDKAGITPPETWDDYITIGKDMVKQGHYMMALSLTSPNPQDTSFFQKLLWQNGGSYFDKQTGAVTLDNDAGKAAMAMYAKIAFAGITSDISPFTPAWFGAWKQDKLITEPGAAWMQHVFPDNIKQGEGSYGQWRVADFFPAFTKGGTKTSNLGGSNIAATDQTQNKAAAIAYCISACAGVDGQAIMAKQGTFPGYLPAHQDPRVRDVQWGVYGDQKTSLPFIALTPLVPDAYWRDSAFPEADVIVNAGLTHVLSKQWAPADGVKQIADQIRAATLRA
jgi:lactose/L-arabinose transport system substrate-binding protein